MNISSIVIQCKSEDYDRVKKQCEESNICDFHFGEKEKGKMVVTIEGKDVSEEIEKLKEIQLFEGVIAADMMMTYQEDMLDEEVKRLNEMEAVPDILTKDNVDPSEVVYHGDLKGKKF